MCWSVSSFHSLLNPHKRLTVNLLSWNGFIGVGRKKNHQVVRQSRVGEGFIYDQPESHKAPKPQAERLFIRLEGKEKKGKERAQGRLNKPANLALKAIIYLNVPDFALGELIMEEQSLPGTRTFGEGFQLLIS